MASLLLPPVRPGARSAILRAAALRGGGAFLGSGANVKRPVCRHPRPSPWAVALLLAAGWVGACAGPGSPVPATPGADADSPPASWTARVDLDGDGRVDSVAAWFDADRRRGVLLVTPGAPGSWGPGGPVGWTSPLYPAWKVRAGDLDGDGRAEVVLGVWSRRKRHDEPEPHRSVWVLAWEGDRLRELWRGSALARPLADFEIEPPDRPGGPALLVADERTVARCYQTRYRWTGFGFSGVDRRPVPCGGRAAGRERPVGRERNDGSD